jgi:hypothetical protein
LIYRLPHQQDLQQRELAPLQDAQRAMKFIRANASVWNVQSNKLGVMVRVLVAMWLVPLVQACKMFLLYMIHWTSFISTQFYDSAIASNIDG